MADDKKAVINVVSRRRYKRFNKECPVKYNVVKFEGLDDLAKTVDISGGGLCFTSEEKIPPGKILAVEVELEEGVLQAIGKIAWTRLTPEGANKTGVEFYWMRKANHPVEEADSLDDIKAQLENAGGFVSDDD